MAQGKVGVAGRGLYGGGGAAAHVDSNKEWFLVLLGFVGSFGRRGLPADILFKDSWVGPLHSSREVFRGVEQDGKFF